MTSRITLDTLIHLEGMSFMVIKRVGLELRNLYPYRRLCRSVQLTK